MCTPDTLLDTDDTDFILTDILTLFNSFQWNILQYVLNAFRHVVEELWIRRSQFWTQCTATILPIRNFCRPRQHYLN